MILDLVHNIALLVALVVGLQMAARNLEGRDVFKTLLTGVLFGGTAIVGMMTPMHFAPGVIYDGRSIVLSLAGLFGGPVVAIIAAGMSGLYRAALGGAGVYAGVGTILEAAALGTVFYFLRKRNDAWVRPFQLWFFAVLVHAVMMLLQLLIPNVGWEILYRVGPAVLLFYPLAFLLIAQVFLDGERRQESLKALKASEERLSLVVRSAELGSWDWDIASGRVTLDERWTGMLGFALNEIVPHVSSWEELVHEEDAPAVQEALNAHLSGTADVYEVRYRLRGKDGSWVWVLDKGSVIERDAHGRPLRMCGTHLNITATMAAEEERKKMEAQLRQSQKMEAVGQLAGGVAHDFNNLLQVILGNAELLQASLEGDREGEQTLNEVTTAAERAAALTRQLLAFSRRQVIQPVPLDMNECIRNILKMIRRVIGENIDLRFMPGDPLHTVHADTGQMEQVLMNLCVNARDAMPSGGGLTIETRNVVLDDTYCQMHPWVQPGYYVLLGVTDTGHGMEESVRKQIFDPFFTTKEMGQGTGLGLATVYGIVKQHGGSINVYSEPGKGTVFKIYLPIIHQEAQILSPAEAPTCSGGTETVLIAEDEEPVRKMIAQILEGAGYQVLTASDGEAAILVFNQHVNDIHLALLDVMMPKRSGREVMDYIRQKRPDMRFLFSSGYSENAIHTDFVMAEGVRLIAKPYHRAELLGAVRETLDAQDES